MNKGQKNILVITLIVMIGIILCSLRLYQIANIPKISLNGSQIITMNLYESYNEEGAQAYRYKKDVSDEIEIKGSIDTNKPGNYEISYEIDGQTITRKIIVKDNISPKLTINGSKELAIEINTEYIDEGATAEDNVDGNITDKIEVTGTVDTSKAGNYEIIYTVKDESGNEISDKRIVTVKETPKPTYTPVIDKVVNSYVKVSIERQTVELYIDNELILSSPIVTGTENYTDSDKGVFKIYSKSKNVYLKGTGYVSFVNYWMPYNRGEGLHDATWRTEFGGEIYKSSGSHGCINMPLDIAAQIYDYVEVGTVVEVY